MGKRTPPCEILRHSRDFGVFEFLQDDTNPLSLSLSREKARRLEGIVYLPQMGERIRNSFWIPIFIGMAILHIEYGADSQRRRGSGN
jgi:hypothetical protein